MTQSVPDSTAPKVAETPDLRSYATVAAQLDLSTDTIFRWLRAKRKGKKSHVHHDFPDPVRIGGAARFVGAEVDKWMADQITAQRAVREVGHDAH